MRRPIFVGRDGVVQYNGQSKHAVDVQGLDHAPISNLRLTNCTFDNVAAGSIVKNVQDVTLNNVKVNGRTVRELA